MPGGHVILARLLIGISTTLVLSSQALAGHPYRAGEVIVKLKAPTAGVSAMHMQRNARSFSQRAKQNHHLNLLKAWDQISVQHMKLDGATNKTVQETIDELSALPEVEFVEPNYIVEKANVEDINSSGGRHYSRAEAQSLVGSMSFGMTLAAIQAAPAWPVLSSTFSHVVVAVIDTGIDLDHPSFSNSIWTNPGEIVNNGIDDDGNGYIDDIHGWNFAYGNKNVDDDEGHGTHVAGIVLGTGQDIFEDPTPATNIEIMALKFLDAYGSGATSDAINAIYYASNMGAKVMNNSWGGGDYSQALAAAIAYAYQKDVLFVAAAGNANNNNDSNQNYPANYDIPNVLSVAATTDSDSKASFSNYGASTVPMASPGVSILSTYPSGTFIAMSGTSMAAPFVAGTAALMRYQSPFMNCYQVRQLLLSSVDIVGALAPYVSTSGRLNVLNAVNAATNATVSSYKPGYLLSINSNNRSLASSMDSRGGGGCGLISNVAKEFWNKKGLMDRFKQVVVSLILILMPLALIQILRSRVQKTYQRKYERYSIDSSVTFKIGDKKLVGAVKTISLGGSELNTEALLKDGSIITMSIASPDGKTKIDVQGHVVWSEEQKRYGVAFDGVSDGIKSQILQWQKVLNKAS